MLLVVLLPAITLRVLVAVVYRPAFLFWQDSYQYLSAAHAMSPPVERPLAYPALLRVLDLVGPLSLVPMVQHVLGLAMGVGIYALLRHRGLGALGSTLAATPVLLDGYQIDIEQFVLSETLFSFLLLLVLGLPLVWRQIGPRRAAVLGILVAALLLTRTVGEPLALVVFTYLALRRVGWRQLAVFAGAAVVPVLGYALWFSSVHGTFGLQLMSGRLLYGKTVQFADCARLSAGQRALCPSIPRDRRLGQNIWSFTPLSPQRLVPYTPAGDRRLAGFGEAVIVRQPGDYAHVVAADLYHYVGPWRVSRPRDQRLVTWELPDGQTPNFTVAIQNRPGWLRGGIKDPVRGPVAGFLHGYQRWVTLPGLGLLGCLAATVIGAVRRRRPSARAVVEPEGGLRLACLLLAVVGVVLVLVPAISVGLDYRLLLPELVVLPLGAALARLHLRGRGDARPGGDGIA
jgi:hypothetical protein